MVPIKEVRKWLKEAGYKKINDTGGYIHPDTGHKLYPLQYRDGCQNWQRWGENGRLPPLPKVVADIRGKWWQIKIMDGENGRYGRFEQLPVSLPEDDLWEMAQAIIRELSRGE